MMFLTKKKLLELLHQHDKCGNLGFELCYLSNEGDSCIEYLIKEVKK